MKTQTVLQAPSGKSKRNIKKRLVGCAVIALTAPEPDKPHTITLSGVRVYDDWRDNIIVDGRSDSGLLRRGRGVHGRDVRAGEQLRFPPKATVVGEMVEVMGIDERRGGLGRGVVARVRRGGQEYQVGLAEEFVDPDLTSAEWLEEYRYWLSLG